MATFSHPYLLRGRQWRKSILLIKLLPSHKTCCIPPILLRTQVSGLSAYYMYVWLNIFSFKNYLKRQIYNKSDQQFIFHWPGSDTMWLSNSIILNLIFVFRPSAYISASDFNSYHLTHRQRRIQRFVWLDSEVLLTYIYRLLTIAYYWSSEFVENPGTNCPNWDVPRNTIQHNPDTHRIMTMYRRLSHSRYLLIITITARSNQITHRTLSWVMTEYTRFMRAFGSYPLLY